MTITRLLEWGVLIGGAILTVLIFVAPTVAYTLELVVIPIVVIGSTIAFWYLRGVYLDLPEPRSRFYRMLLQSQAAKIGSGYVVLWIVISILASRMLHIELPTFPPGTAAPIVGLIFAILLSMPIYYAFEIWKARRDATAEGLRDAVDSAQSDGDT